jgi:hypothetical protein
MREMKSKAGNKNHRGESSETKTYKFGRAMIQLNGRTQLISNRELRLLDSMLSC